MFHKVFMIGFALSLVACGGDDLPSTTSATSAAVTSTATALALYADTYSLYTGGVTNLSVSGGTAPYTFTLSDSTLGSLTGTTFTSVSAGTETIVVTDATGAIASVGISIVDATSTTTTSLITKPIYRFRHDAPYLWHLFTADVNGDASYAPNAEGIQYHVYVSQESGTVPLFACKMNNYLQIRFNSLSASCEGQLTTGVIVGYTLPQGTPGAGFVSLWRHSALLCPSGIYSCYYAIFESVDENPPAGYTKVGQIGIVPVQ